jgi:Tim44-like domain
MKEDAREAWETSQNPWVYRASSVYDTLTQETAESIAVKELRVLDPDFTLDDWRQDVVEHTLPQIMEWFLQGKVNQLKPWLGEGVFKRIASEVAARKQEGVQIDTHVLGIMNSEILAVEVCRFYFLMGVTIDLCSIDFSQPFSQFSRQPILARRSQQRISHHFASFHVPTNKLCPKEGIGRNCGRIRG